MSNPDHARIHGYYRKSIGPPTVCCVEKNCTPVPVLTVCPWQAVAWTLPWCRLDSVSSGQEGELERVDLFFPNHQVVIIGEQLRETLDYLRLSKVFYLRSYPAAHRICMEADAVFISQLEVRLLADLKGEAKHMVGAIVPRGGQWFFYKLTGDAAAVSAARESFVSFIKTAK